MIRALSSYFVGVPPVFIDGLLYAAMAFLTFSQAYLGGDEAAKWIAPAAKFWINYAVGGTAALAAAIKMFRSTSFGEHLEQKRKNGDTTIIPKP